VVKIGKNKTTGKNVAIKSIDKKNAGTKGVAMVQTEVQILFDCDHPNIVKLYEAYETTDHYLLVMELVSGGELFDKIVELQSYSEKVASQLVRQMVSAIQHFHSKNIVHRDLKPENLLLVTKTLDSPIVLADFGLSKYLDPTEPLNVPVGTPGYVAPEVVECLDNDQCAYGKEIDLWAVGVILYIMLCGYPPFYSEDDDEVFDQILDGNYTYPSPHWDNISGLAKDLIDHLLVLNPNKRFSAEDTLNHPWLKGADVPDKPLGETQEQLKKFNARRKWKSAILATVALSKLTSKLAILQLNSSHKEMHALPHREGPK